MPQLSQSHRLRKTSAGALALKTRDKALSARARTLLILIDGNRKASELAAFSPNADESLLLLVELIAAGFAEIVDGAPLATHGIAPSPTAPVVAVLIQTNREVLTDSINAATNFLDGWMGSASEPYRQQLESCESLTEFEATVHEIKTRLAASGWIARSQLFEVAALGR